MNTNPQIEFFKKNIQDLIEKEALTQEKADTLMQSFLTDIFQMDWNNEILTRGPKYKLIADTLKAIK